MNPERLSCQDTQRRRDIRQALLNGLDFVEVDLGASQTSLRVFFLGKAPAELTKNNVQIRGGQRIRDVRVTDIRIQRQKDPTLDDYLDVTVAKVGDASTYTLQLVALDENGHPTDEPLEGFDPGYASVEFSFRAGCPTSLDCGALPDCPPPARETPEIDYLAKDYDSFRRLMLDRLALTLPDFRERHAPDLGVALVELLAYTGDYLSYYQDAVATEAYLGTARQRISVRRHARLVDYAMHEGVNARAWVTLWTDTDATLDPAKVSFITRPSDLPDARSLQPEQYASLQDRSFQVFEPLVPDSQTSLRVYAAHSEIHFYTWGKTACCLPFGATSAALTDSWLATESEGENADSGRPKRALELQEGDVLILEEVLGPNTGSAADADPRHRQAVRLTRVTRVEDPLYRAPNSALPQPVVEIEWCAEDALTFPLCISARSAAPECAELHDVSVARGNVVLVDHGARCSESLGEVPAGERSQICSTRCGPADVMLKPARFRPKLPHRVLTFAVPLPPCGCASALSQQDPRQALPQMWLTGRLASPQGDYVTRWLPKLDLLAAGAADLSFVVEMDDEGTAHLRFGDGALGAIPDPGTAFEVSYRVGNGPLGNVGAEAIRCIVFREVMSGLGRLAPRNPLAAAGGVPPESLEEVKRLAPLASRQVLERAVTADDYAALAADDARRLVERAPRRPSALPALLELRASTDDPRAADEVEPGETSVVVADACERPFQRLQGARARLRWTGSWYEAQVALDPLGGEPDASLIAEMLAYLERYRRIGHDLDVRAARYVPIDLLLSICVKSDFQRGHVERELLAAFSNRRLPDGKLGFFHADSLSFAEAVYVSRIMARAQAVPGVLDVRVVQLERFDPTEPEPDFEDELPPNGRLELGPFEIARLDNDPNFPENGRLRLVLRGGR
jgi:hypothetical protein